MTIRKGEPWGTTGPLPEGAVTVWSDAEAAEVVAHARRLQRAVPVMALLGGDLCRTLGGTGDAGRLSTDEVTIVPVDLGVATLDGTIRYFVAHLVARHRWWAGRAVVAMNAEWLGTWDLAPRSHPNDGLLDITDGSLGPKDRVLARRRVPTGTHLPHPGLSTRRVPAARFELASPCPVRLDGVAVGRSRVIDVHLEPDAITVAV